MLIRTQNFIKIGYIKDILRLTKYKIFINTYLMNKNHRAKSKSL